MLQVMQHHLPVHTHVEGLTQVQATRCDSVICMCAYEMEGLGQTSVFKRLRGLLMVRGWLGRPQAWKQGGRGQSVKDLKPMHQKVGVMGKSQTWSYLAE